MLKFKVKFNEYFPLVKGCLVLYGLDVDKPQTYTPRIAYVFFAVNSILLTLQLLSITREEKSLADLVYSISIAGIYFLPISIFERAIHRQKNISKLILGVEAVVDDWKPLDIKKRLKKSVFLVRLLAFISVYSACNLILAICGIPMLVRLLQEDSIYLPYSLWPPPCDLTQGYCFYPVHITETLSLYSLAFSYGALTSVHLGVLTYICGLFQVVSDGLKALRPNPGLEGQLMELSKKHVRLLELVGEYNILFSRNTFERQIWGTVFISFAGFQIVLHPTSSPLAYTLCGFTWISLFVLAWCGEQLKMQSASLRTAAWFAHWEDGMPSYALKHLQMFMIRAQKPSGFRSGPFGNANYSWFTTISKSSYSYLQVLRNTYADFS